VQHGFGARREHCQWTVSGAQTAGAEGGGKLLGEAVSVVEVAGDKDLAQRGGVVTGGDGAVEAGAAGEDKQRRGKGKSRDAAQESRTEREQGFRHVEKVRKGRLCGKC
jgi:hypothetical protein